MTKATKKNMGGRPRIPESAKAGVLSVRFPPALLQALDEVVASRIDGADRSAVIREYVADGVQRAQKRRP